jgi:hypothetical protein
MIQEEINNSQNSNQSIMNKTFIASFSQESILSDNFTIKANNLITPEVSSNSQEQFINKIFKLKNKNLKKLRKIISFILKQILKHPQPKHILSNSQQEEQVRQQPRTKHF